jgi:hypothetical protein
VYPAIFTMLISTMVNIPWFMGWNFTIVNFTLVKYTMVNSNLITCTMVYCRTFPLGFVN